MQNVARLEGTSQERDSAVASSGAASSARRWGGWRRAVETLRVGLDPDRGIMRSLTETDMTDCRIGTRRFLVLMNPDAVDHVLHKARLNYVKSLEYEPIKAGAGINLLTDEGDSWASHRAVLNPKFAKRQLNQIFALMVAPMGDMLDRRVAQGDRFEFDMHEEMVMMTLRVVANSLFSQDFGPVVDSMHEQTTKGMKAAETLLRLTLVGALPSGVVWTLITRLAFSRLPTPPPFNVVQEVFQNLDDAVNVIVNERLAHPTDTPDLLNTLIEADGGKWPRKRIRDEALTFMLAGHETTANGMSWFWYLMALNPDARQKMLDEVDSVLGGRRITLEDLDHLPWTTACMQESQRYYSAVPVILRTALEDDEINGHGVSKGTTVLVPIHAIHHDERYWDGPETFDPSRFMPGAPRPHRSAFLPFGGGRRVCIGQSFALMEMVAIAAMMSQHFVYDLAPGHPVVPAQSLTLRPKYGLPVIAKRRDVASVTTALAASHAAPAATCPIDHERSESK